jgi:hypothetical protein
VNLRLAEGDLLVFVSDDMATVAVHKRVDAAAVCSKSAGMLTGGTHSVTRKPSISSRYYGVWVNVSPRFSNWWWEMNATGVTIYEYDARKSCDSWRIKALGPDQVLVQDGSTRSGLHLTEGNLLLALTEDGSGNALMRRTDGSAICRNPDGTYGENAPHVAPPR